MATNRDTPVYNLKAVVRDTGIKPDTLRAWERRYGVPAPHRTPSGHRLYSQRDIAMLRWLLARQEEGLSISRAVELWRRLQDEEQNGAAEVHGSPASAALPGADLHADLLSVMRDQWVEACLQFDERTAEQTLAQAFALFPIEAVLLQVIQRGLALIGDLWYKGRATVQQEHFASALAVRRVEVMLSAAPPPTRPGRILIGCPPEEEHSFVPLLLALLMRRRGWDVVYLGANVPVSNLEATLATTRPALVVLAAQQLITAAGLLDMALLLLRERVPLAFGGLIFNRLPELRRIVPGSFLGEQLDGAVAQVERIMTNLQVQPAERIVGAEAREALLHFRERQAAIEAGVWTRFEGFALPPRLLAAANDRFGRHIAAALALGNMEYLAADMEWIEGLLLHHVGLQPEQVEVYVGAYLAAARRVLDERGRPVLQWLAHLVGDQTSVDSM
jgi:DNA-binding transcriptional MerR regulator